jgi:hypothetical protein
MGSLVTFHKWTVTWTFSLSLDLCQAIVLKEWRHHAVSALEKRAESLSEGSEVSKWAALTRSMSQCGAKRRNEPASKHAILAADIAQGGKSATRHVLKPRDRHRTRNQSFHQLPARDLWHSSTSRHAQPIVSHCRLATTWPESLVARATQHPLPA